MANINNPIVNAPNEYIYGLELAKTGNQTLVLFPGEARNNSNVNDIDLQSSTTVFNIPAITINGAIVGPNGMARAVMAANTSYYVFVIGDSNQKNPTAGLLDTAQFGVQLPNGYDMYRRVGFIHTDGSANILSFYQTGCGVERTYFYDVIANCLTGGNATTFTPIQLNTNTGIFPANSFHGLVYLDVTYTPAAAANIAQFLPAGSTATTGMVRFGTGVAATQIGQVCVPYRTLGGVPQIQYKVTAGGDSLTLSVAGYTESLAE